MAYASGHRSRTKRFNLRATENQQKLIRIVARRQGMNVTEFILESACRQAEQALADQRQFLLSESQWKAFTEALDRPVRHKPRLKKLLFNASILERPE